MRGSSRMADKPPCRVPGETMQTNVTTEHYREIESSSSSKIVYATSTNRSYTEEEEAEEGEREKQRKGRKMLKETKRENAERARGAPREIQRAKRRATGADDDQPETPGAPGKERAGDEVRVKAFE